MKKATSPIVWAVWIVVLALTGCGTIHVSETEFLHMLCVDQNGDPADVTPKRPDGKVPGHDEHAVAIVKAFRAWQQEDPANNQRMMLIIHGGLVSMSDAVKDVRKALPEMKKSKEKFFPVFINWETGLFTSYADHLFRVRGGERAVATAIATSPFVFVYDVGRALVRYPITLGNQVVNLRDYHYYGDDHIVPTPRGWEGLAVLDPSPSGRDGWDVTGDILVEFVPGLLRLVTTPVLDAFGLPAFENMRRRARVLMRRDDDFGQNYRGPTGAVSVLMRKLIADTLSRDEKRPVPVTLVAHSMGTIVANQTVREFGYRDLPGKPGQFLIEFPDIVFMGAACTIREFADTTLSYVLRRKARFYNLCLHPQDEEDDLYGKGVLPHGSLLEWIDDYITVQRNEMDRTLGKWNNIARVLRVMDWIEEEDRGRIKIKGFARKAGNPRDHGDFNNVDFKFWERSFWEPVSAR